MKKGLVSIVDLLEANMTSSCTGCDGSTGGGGCNCETPGPQCDACMCQGEG